MSRDESLHDGSRTYIPNQGTPLVTTQSILDSFVRKLADINRRTMLKGADGDIQATWDPTDIRAQIESMCAAARLRGSAVDAEHADAIGAYALALQMAVARVEDQAPHLGDAA